MGSVLRDPRVIPFSGPGVGWPLSGRSSRSWLPTHHSGLRSDALSLRSLLGHLAKAALLTIVSSNRPLLIPPEQTLGSEMISLMCLLAVRAAVAR